MRSETSLIAENVRINNWALQVEQCQNRPKGMDVQTWCAQNGIKRSIYYYRLRKVREAMLYESKNENTSSFIEIPSSPFSEESATEATAPSSVASIQIGSMEMKIHNGVSMDFLKNLIGAMKVC